MNNKNIYIICCNNCFNENDSIIAAVDNETIAKNYCNERNICKDQDIRFYYKELTLNKYCAVEKYLIQIEEYDNYKDKDISINKYYILNKEKYDNKLEYNPLGYLQIQIIIDKKDLNLYDDKYCKKLFYNIKNKLSNGVSLDEISNNLNVC